MQSHDRNFIVATAGDTAALSRIYRQIAVLIGLLVLSAAVFVLAPWLDVAMSRQFYQPGAGFVLRHTLPVVAMRGLGIWISIGTVVGLIALALWWGWRPDAMRRWPSATPRLDWWFIMLGMLIGPGVLVNLVFKPIWGRARPIHVTQFGGNDLFTPAWVVAHQCEWNCSFFSGEAAASAYFLAFCFVVTPRWRLATLAAGVVLTALVSYARMAAGGHFLSDVVTAWLMMGVMILVLYAQMYHHALLGPFKKWLPRRPGLSDGDGRIS